MWMVTDVIFSACSSHAQTRRHVMRGPGFDHAIAPHVHVYLAARKKDKGQSPALTIKRFNVPCTYSNYSDVCTFRKEVFGCRCFWLHIHAMNSIHAGIITIVTSRLDRGAQKLVSLMGATGREGQ
jgi:hypothetical protein